MTAVGFIGVGRMGGPMAGHVLRGGHEVTVFDPHRPAVKAVERQGAVAADSPAEVGRRSDIVVVTVGTAEQAHEAVDGPVGALQGCAPGALVVLSSTVAPKDAIAMARRCSDAGVRFLDAPVCRAERGAVEGRLLWLVGGSATDLDDARTVMACCGPDVFHVGDVPAGQVAKSINNMILWAALCADHEGFSLADAYGLDREALRAALSVSTASNWALENWPDMQAIPWARKDMIITLQMADESGVALPLAGLVREEVKRHHWAAGYS